MTYFDKLNYTLSNEDTRVEELLLPENTGSVFSIAGSGARVIPLVAKNPKELSVIDVSINQLHLCELRLAAAKTFTLPEHLFFLGYRGGTFEGPSTGDDRMDLFKRLELSDACEAFWTRNAGLWMPKGFVYLGSWESHFIQLARIFRSVLRMDMLPIFESQTLEEQCEMVEKHWKPTLFRNFLRVVASEYVFNKFLYKGHFAGSKDRKTEARPPWQLLDDEFRRLFTTTLVRKNYMMQLFFLGKIHYEEGLPLEVQPATLGALKRSKTKVHYVQKDLVESLASKPFDFISLSDTISYLPDEAANAILQKLHPNCAPGSTLVMRSFLRAPQAIDERGWTPDATANAEAYELDGTGIYRFHIYRKAGIAGTS